MLKLFTFIFDMFYKINTYKFLNSFTVNILLLLDIGYIELHNYCILVDIIA